MTKTRPKRRNQKVGFGQLRNELVKAGQPDLRRPPKSWAFYPLEPQMYWLQLASLCFGSGGKSDSSPQPPTSNACLFQLVSCQPSRKKKLFKIYPQKKMVFGVFGTIRLRNIPSQQTLNIQEKRSKYGVRPKKMAIRLSREFLGGM